MIDLEFRFQATPRESFRRFRFGDVGDSVLYHSLPRLASGERFGPLVRNGVTQQLNVIATS